MHAGCIQPGLTSAARIAQGQHVRNKKNNLGHSLNQINLINHLIEFLKRLD